MYCLSYSGMALSLRIGFLTVATLCLFFVNHTPDALLSVIYFKLRRNLKTFTKTVHRIFLDSVFFFYHLAHSFLSKFNSKFLSKTIF